MSRNQQPALAGATDWRKEMTSFATYRSDKEAIRGATKVAREAARDNGEKWVEMVLLRSGDTLIITATPGGKISHRITAGWVREGLLHCGPTATRVGVM